MSGSTRAGTTIAAMALTFAATAFTGCSGTRPTDLGLVDGQLRACPESPNCVSTEADDADHAFEPIPYEGDRAEALARMKAVIESEARVEIVTAREDYLHAEFTSAIMRYVDDVEVHAPADDDALHLRSASRVGYSDLGVNRRRLERLRDAFLER